MITTFTRIEKKYFITPELKKQLMEQIGDRFEPTEYPVYEVRNVYLDTPDCDLIQRSIDARDENQCYKEKLRLRAYDTPSEETRVFLEIKKKFQGKGYKRRVAMKLKDAETYFQGDTPLTQLVELRGDPERDRETIQKAKEIGYAYRLYHHPQPKYMILYQREAYQALENPDLRITFDTDIRYRTDDMDLKHGPEGIRLFEDDRVLMEIKTDGAMPLWLCKTLKENHILPTSFSKVGTAYQDDHRRQRKELKNGEKG